jgi:hypothetical protein
MTEPAVGRDGAPSAGSPAATGQTSAASIVAAAERLATEITRNAEAEADAIRARAGSDSDAARAAITERVRRLSALADGMLERLGEMRAELDALSGSLAGAAPADAVALAAAPEPGAAVAPEPGAAVAPEPGAAVAPEPGAGAVPEPGAGAVPEPGAPADVDDAGARLIALNLALSDTPRDEAARQLRGQVPDPERLVAEVYASVKH